MFINTYVTRFTCIISKFVYYIIGYDFGTLVRKKVSKTEEGPTLVIAGTDDNFYEPHAKALVIVGKIPGAWLVQIKDAGH
ncbi:MAG: hypothetical protein WAZ77_02370, partial [Candidatus Nitrosopolaris sp.]